MKKGILISICILIICVLLIPIPMRLKDGGSVIYQAILYSVEDIHRLNPAHAEKPYIDGIRIKIFGVEIYHRQT